MGLFKKLKESLKKTRENFTEQLNLTFKNDQKIDAEFYEQLEEILILADLGPKTTEEIIEKLKEKIKEKKIKLRENAKNELKLIIEELLENDESEENAEETSNKKIILVVGVNGVGKTTTIAKLAANLKEKGKKVMLCAADTFRAAAIEQLEFWAKQTDCPIVKHNQGSDPAAVVFDSIVSAKKRNVDVLICDTAGRLHTKQNLMKEMEKIYRVIGKEAQDLEIETLLIIDASTGQNGLIQAEKFKESANLTGIVLTKLDGTAKGGIAISIKKNLNIPIKFIGTGEKLTDLQKFNAKDFTKALFDDDYDGNE